MAEIIKIALSGGPCSGKTTCINKIVDYYKQKGICVLVCPESATQIIDSGASREDMLEFEIAVANNQLRLECELDSKFKTINSDKFLVIYDRGLTDCFGYVDDKDALADAIGIDRISSWARYDAVMILESANDYVSNDVRIETRSQADEYANRVLSAWMGHQHLRYIPSSDNYDDKLETLIGEIDCIVDNIECEKKYLIEYPNIDELSKYNPVKAHIEQVYLLSDVGSHRIRKRIVNDVCSYFETIKIRITDAIATEIENIISENDYEKLLAIADPKKCTIEKDRYCFLYNNQYFELDVFPFWDDKAFLELELRNSNQAVDLPFEISIIKDVSEDKRYKNNNLSSLLYKRMNNENSKTDIL